MNHGAVTTGLIYNIPAGPGRSISASAVGRLTLRPVSNLQGVHVSVRVIFEGGACDEA